MKIKLTKEECNVLATILSMVGGCPDRSARKFSESIQDKLAKLGVYSTHAADLRYPVKDEHCSIRFADMGESQ